LDEILEGYRKEITAKELRLEPDEEDLAP